MATATLPTTLAPVVGAGVPAGLNPAQTRAFERLVAARAALTCLESLDPTYLAAERSCEQLARWNGEDV